MTQLGEAFVPVRATMDKLDKDLAEAKGKINGAVGSIGESLKSIGTVALAGVLAAIALVTAAIVGIGTAAFSVAADFQKTQALLQTQLGLTAEEAAELGDVVTEVFGNNFGESLGDVGQAVGEVQQQLGDFTGFTEDSLVTATEAAFALRDAFGVEVRESVSAANALMSNFGLTSDEAFAFVALGLQSGLNSSDDFLDSIGEYSVQFAEGGATADEFFSTMATGLQTGMLGTDKAADLFKEFRVRIQDGSDLTSKSLQAIGLDAEGMAAALADGSLSAMDAFTLVQRALKDTDDQSVLFNAGVGLMGTQFEDLGQEAVAAIDPLSWSLRELSELQPSLNAQYDNFGSLLEGIKRKGQVALLPLGETLLGLANEAMPAVQDFLTNSLLPALTTFSEWIANEAVPALKEWIPILIDQLVPVLATFSEWISNKVIPALQAFGEWFQANQEVILKVLAAIAIGFAAFSIISTVVGWITGLIAAIGAMGAAISAAGGIIGAIVALLGGPVTIVIAVVAGLVALFAAAWMNDWGGIQTKLTEVWEGTIKPALEQLQAWLAVNVPIALEALRSFWVDVVWPAIQNAIAVVWPIIEGIFVSIRDWVVGTLIPTLEDLYLRWTTEWWPTIQTVLENVWTVIEEIFIEIGRWVNDNIVPWIEFLHQKWVEEIWPAIQKAIQDVWAVIEPIWIDLVKWFQETIPVALEALQPIFEGVMAGINTAVQPVKDLWDELVGAVQGFWEWLTSHEFSFSISLPDLPDWMIPDSPIPLHTAWKNFSDFLRQTKLDIQMEAPVLQQLELNSPVSAGDTNYSLTLMGGAGESRGVMRDFSLLKGLAGVKR